MSLHLLFLVIKTNITFLSLKESLEMSCPQTEDVRQGISVLWENLQCPICLDLMVMPVSTECDHQFCKLCMMKLLDRSKRKEASCPVCTMKIMKRTLQESPGFQRLVEGLKYLVQSYEFDTCTDYFTGTQRKQQKRQSIEMENLHFKRENELSIEMEKPQDNDISLSSSEAAKDGFAQLMDFENSFPMNSEEEGVDISKLLPNGLELHDNDIFTLEKRKELQGPGRTEVNKTTSKDELGVFLPKKRSLRQLEEQVFGTVYKRDRKTSKHSPNKELSLKTDTAPNPLCLAEEGERDMAEINNKEALNEQTMPVGEMPIKIFGHKLMSEMQGLSNDLNENMNDKRENKRRIRKNNSDNVIGSSQSRKAKCLKSITLVNAGTDSNALNKNLVRNPKTIETDVHIEMLSSEDPRSPDTRSAKRSLKLHHFTEEVQAIRCKKRSKQVHEDFRSENVLANTSHWDNVDHLDGNTSADIEGTNVKSMPQRKKTEVVVKKNECICKSDFEKLQSNSCDTCAFVKGGQLPLEKPLTVVPETIQDEPSVPCSVSLVSNSSHIMAVVPLLEKHQEDLTVSPLAGNTSSSAIVCAVQSRYIEKDIDTNDSEQDTEQLLRTFKTTKRKSFYLDSLNATFSGRTVPSFRNGVDCADSTDETKENSIAGANKKNDSPSGFTSSFGRHSPSNFFEPTPPETSQLKNSKTFGNVGSTSVFQLPKQSVTDNSEVVDSILLFPVLNAMEDEPQNQSCTTSEEKQGLKTPFCDPGTSESSSKNQEHIAQTFVASSENLRHSSGNNSCSQSLTSSMTPDGLVVGDASPVTGESLHMVKENNTEGVSLPNMTKKKRRAQRLNASDSELSAGKDCLPSISRIYKYHSDHQSSKGPLAVVLNQKDLQFSSKRKNSGLGTSSQCSSSFNEPESWSECQERVPSGRQSNGTGTLATLHNSNMSVLLNKDDRFPASQGSVDLFATPEEYAVDGFSGDAKLSVDSSQYEVINTQQKVEMQNELLRLERMMVLVSEALCKESDCGSKAGTECMKEVWKGKKMERNCSDDLKTVQLKAIISKTQAKKGQYSTRERQQSLSNGLSSQWFGFCSGVKPLSFTFDQSQRPTDRLEEKGVERGASPAHTKTNGTVGIGTSCGVVELVASGLTANEMTMMKKFARKMGCSLKKQMTPNTTHIIIKTDRFLVCERTLKYFQGIAGRKWVVSFQWVSESFKQGKVLDEVLFEVCGDVVNGDNHNGPLKARKTSDDNLLLKGYKICFHGSFTYMSKGQMEMMVKMCGASVVTDPLMFSTQGKCQMVVVQSSSADDYEFYKALQQKATVVSRSWLLDSIATYTLQSPEHYRL